MTIRDTHAHHRQQRYAIPKPVSIATGGQTHKGGILDISASGAAIRLDVQLEDGTRVDLLIKDTRVDLLIKDMGQVAAHVARKLDDGVAVEFDTDPAKEAAFLDALAQAIDAARRDAGPATPVS
jgi:hypothetical protein